MNDTKFPLISVIVPSYNQGQFLRQTLISIFDQAYSNLEAIVMDGGSTDDSVEIIREFEGKLAYWQTAPDGGQAAAINAGMKRAKGELITWLNSDDYYLKDAFTKVLKQYRKNPDASFYAGNGFRVAENGMIKAPFFKHENIVFDRNGLIFSVDYILQPATFMSGRYLAQVGYLNQGLNYGMDWDLYIRLSACADPVIYFDFIAVSREYPETKTSSGYFKRIEELRCIAKEHSGYEITPGVMLYLIGDLMSFSRKHPDLYDKSYLLELYKLWGMNKMILEQSGLDLSGFIFPIRKPTQRELFFRRVGKSFAKLYQQFYSSFVLPLKLKFRPLMRAFGASFRYVSALPRTSPYFYKLFNALLVVYYRIKHGLYAK